MWMATFLTLAHGVAVQFALDYIPKHVWLRLFSDLAELAEELARFVTVTGRRQRIDRRIGSKLARGMLCAYCSNSPSAAITSMRRLDSRSLSEAAVSKGGHRGDLQLGA